MNCKMQVGLREKFILYIRLFHSLTISIKKLFILDFFSIKKLFNLI